MEQVVETTTCSLGEYCMAAGNGNLIQVFRLDGSYEPYHEECVVLHSCENCGHQRVEDDLVNIDSHSYCCDTYDCYFVCSDCEYQDARGYGNRHHGDLYCNSCYDERTADEEESEIIKDYSANPLDYLNFFGKPKDNMFFGVELEVEVSSGDREEIAEGVLATLPNFAIAKSDGSIDYGFEIVSAPATLQEHYAHWKDFFSKKFPLRSFQTKTCGMHVHISRDALKPSQIGRMYVFMHNPTNIQLIEAVAGRSLRRGNGGHYAPLYNPASDYREIPRQLREMKLTERVTVETELPYRTRSGKLYPVENPKKYISYKSLGHRGAINDCKMDTIEIRIFKGTLKAASFFKNLEFCRALSQFCKPGVVSIRGLTTENFRKFVTANRKEYPHLCDFLHDRFDNETQAS